jgi:hypothetical protein
MAGWSICIDVWCGRGQASCSGVNLACVGLGCGLFLPQVGSLWRFEGTDFFQNGVRGVTLG